MPRFVADYQAVIRAKRSFRRQISCLSWYMQLGLYVNGVILVVRSHMSLIPILYPTRTPSYPVPAIRFQSLLPISLYLSTSPHPPLLPPT